MALSHSTFLAKEQAMAELKRRGCPRCHEGPLKKAYEDETEYFAFYVHPCGHMATVHIPVDGLSEGWRKEPFDDALEAGLLKEAGGNKYEVDKEVYNTWRCRTIQLQD
jgi:hypothetical protein